MAPSDNACDDRLRRLEVQHAHDLNQAQQRIEHMSQLLQRTQQQLSLMSMPAVWQEKLRGEYAEETKKLQAKINAITKSAGEIDKQREQLANELKQFQTRWDQAQAEMKRAQAEMTQAQAGMKQAQAEVTQAQAGMKQAQAEVKQTQEERQKAEAGRAQAEQELKTTQEQFRKQSQTLKQLNGEIERLQRQLREASAHGKRRPAKKNKQG